MNKIRFIYLLSFLFAFLTACDSGNVVSQEADKYAVIIDAYSDVDWQEDIVDDIINGFVEKISVELSLDDRKEYELHCSSTEARFEDLGYAIHDINNDNVPELIILSEDCSIYAIYTLHSDTPYLVGAYWSRSRCVINEEGILFVHASSGASDSYSASYLLAPENVELQLIEMVGIESFDEQENERLTEPRCYRIKNGDKTIIDYDEALAAWENFPDVYPDNPTQNAGFVFVSLK